MSEEKTKNNKELIDELFIRIQKLEEKLSSD